MSIVCEPLRMVGSYCLEAPNNQIVFREGLDVITAIVPPGVYLPIVDADTSGCGFQSLYGAIAQAMTDASDGVAAVSGSTFQMFRGDPELSDSYADFSGVTITSDQANGGVEFELLFSDPGFTLDRRIFGQPFDYSVDELSDGGEFIGDHTAFLTWVSPRCPSEWRKDKIFEQCRTTGTHRSRRTNRWGGIEVRRVIIRKVAAGLVYEGRNNSEDWYQAAGLAQGDSGNVFETLWCETLSKDLDVVVFWEQGNKLGDFSNPEGYDVARLFQERQQDDFRNMRRIRNSRGEFYDLDFELELMKPSTWRF